MTDEKLIKYINANLAKGHSLEEIRQFVAKHGYSQEDIDKAMLEASGRGGYSLSPVGAPPAKGQVPVKKKGHKRIIIALIILVIIIFIFLYTLSDIVSLFTGMYPDSVLPFNMSFFG